MTQRKKNRNMTPSQKIEDSAKKQNSCSAEKESKQTKRKTITLRTEVEQSFRVAQVTGMFDLSVEKQTEQTVTFDLPSLESSDWRIGLIVGPSGSGKSTVANELFSKEIYRGGNWPKSSAILDGFKTSEIKRITETLTVVGFSSPPSWVKPYAVLSNGEKFRCDLARALLDSETNTVVFDEFTSVVDRTVAKICSAAVSKGIKKGFINKRFVAVTCHYDVAQWLEPDWILDMATGQVVRRSLRRPKIKLRILVANRDLWKLFSRHHYLSDALSPSAQCYTAVWEGQPVAFCALLPLYGCRGRRRVSRLVVLPDFQGIGIGSVFLCTMGQICKHQGLGLNITTSHPAMIHFCAQSTRWKTVSFRKFIKPSIQFGKKYKGASGRATASFEFLE